MSLTDSSESIYRYQHEFLLLCVVHTQQPLFQLVHIKNKRLLIGGSLLSEKESLLFTRVAPRIKSKGLPIDTPHIFYYFQHALHRVQKVRGSVGMCSRFIILIIKFAKVFAA
jgi:hypothetical protein